MVDGDKKAKISEGFSGVRGMSTVLIQLSAVTV